MGLRLWLLQRGTALCMAFYATLLYSHFSQEALTYLSLQSFFEPLLMKAVFVLTVWAISCHAAIGIWTIATDYLKCRCIRYAFLGFYNFLLVLACADAVLCVARFS